MLLSARRPPQGHWKPQRAVGPWEGPGGPCLWGRTPMSPSQVREVCAHLCAGAAPHPAPPVWGQAEQSSLHPLAGSDPQEWGFCRTAAPGLGFCFSPAGIRASCIHGVQSSLLKTFSSGIFGSQRDVGLEPQIQEPHRCAVPWHWGDFPVQKPNFTTQSTGRAKGGETESQEGLPYGEGKERPQQ